MEGATNCEIVVIYNVKEEKTATNLIKTLSIYEKPSMVEKVYLMHQLFNLTIVVVLRKT